MFPTLCSFNLLIDLFLVVEVKKGDKHKTGILLHDEDMTELIVALICSRLEYAVVHVVLSPPKIKDINKVQRIQRGN